MRRYSEMNRHEYDVFRNECGNYFFYLARIGELNDILKQVMGKMEGVKSIEFDHPISGNTTLMTGSRVIRYMDRKDELLGQLEEYKSKISYILHTINSFPDPSYRAAAWMVYVQGLSMERVSEIYGMKRQTLQKHLMEQLIDE